MNQTPPPLVDPKMLCELTNYLNEKERSIEEKVILKIILDEKSA